MTAQEALATIKGIPISVIDCLSAKELEAVKMAVDALERQVPKKPEKEEIHYNAQLFRYFCPYCREILALGRSVEVIPHKLKCPDCGQYIDWSDVT